MNGKIPFREDFPPRNDVVFSILFGDKDLFSELILSVTERRIQFDKVISQATVEPDDVEHRSIRFDTYAHKNDTIYGADLQNTYSEILIKNRTVYYACMTIGKQIVKKGRYEDLNRVIVSFIMTKKANNTPVEVIRLRNEQGEVYTDLLTLYNVYVPTVNQAENVNERLRIFSKFFSVSSREEMEDFVTRFSENALAVRLINAYSKAVLRGDLNEIIRKEYFDMKITEQDIKEAVAEAEARGEARGEADGEKRGFLKALVGLVKDGLLTITQAAERANMTVEDFELQSADLV